MEIDNDSCDKNSTNAMIAEDDCIGLPEDRVFNIPELRQQILTFLPVASIKTCRLVSRGWNATAEQVLLKCSHILFSNDRISPEVARLPNRFMEEFRNSWLLHKFDKFCFEPKTSIDYEELENFIENFGDGMKELTYFQINVRCVLYSLGQEERIKLIPSNLSKLDVVSEGVQTNLIISMDRLKNIKILRIGGGVLKIVKDVTPAPIELQLKNVFFLENRKCSSVKVNSLFDFHNLQILRLDCSETKNMELDLAGNVNLKSLTLENVKISNWESSNWTVKDLTLGENMNFRTATGMKFDQLDIRSNVIDIALLPNSLKSLTLRLKTNILNIDNLKDLECLILHRQISSILSNFHRCPKLTNLHLITDGDSSVIDLNLIPIRYRNDRTHWNFEVVSHRK